MNRTVFVGISGSMALVSGCAAPAVAVDGSSDAPAISATVTTQAPSSSAHQAPSAPIVSVAQSECKFDTECALSTNAGCCSCCPCAPVHAMSVVDLKGQEEKCAVIECSHHCDDKASSCPKCVNPADEGMHARCLEGRCTLVER